MIDFILHAVTFVAWLIYTFPPLSDSKNRRVRTVRVIAMAVLGACIGFSFGWALSDFVGALLK